MFERLTATEMKVAFAWCLAPEPQQIIARISAERDVPISDITGRCRTREIVHARQDCMAEIYDRTGLSLAETGRLFDRDQTTVIHSLRASSQRSTEGANK